MFLQFYKEKFDLEGVYQGVERITDEVPEQVVRRWVEELKVEYYPSNPVIPQTAAVQDRHVVEVVGDALNPVVFVKQVTYIGLFESYQLMQL